MNDVVKEKFWDAVRQFKDLPVVLKVAGVVVGALLLFTVLSPLALRGGAAVRG